MPSLVSLTNLTGDGTHSFGGPVNATDIDVYVSQIGGGGRLVSGNPTHEIRHVGWVALGYSINNFSGGPPEIGWWSYFEFDGQDLIVQPSLGDYDTLSWHVEAGCIVNLNVSG